MRISGIRVLQIIGNSYVKIFQSIPLLFWILFFYYAFPGILPSAIADSLNTYFYYPIIAGIISLTLENASYVSDILKSGRLLIPQTQRDVAIATGLGRVQQYIYVLLPQMFRVMFPPLGTRMVHNFKNTTLCMIITAQELTWATQQIESLAYRGVEAIIIATAFYFGVSILMASFVIIIERHFRIDAERVSSPKA